MKNPANSSALRPYFTTAITLVMLLSLLLPGCSLTRPAARPAVYDFGPGRLTGAPARQAAGAPLVLDEVQSSNALDSSAVLYRLAYADAQQLRPYALARWSMPPAQLVRQRLREHLGQDRALLEPGGVYTAATQPVPATRPITPASLSPLTLRLELEEFSQLFEAPTRSVGLLRLRATLTQASVSGDQLLAQTSLVIQRPAPSADAAGAVQALRLATDAAAQELSQWLQQVAP